jgi:hypothetical protein
MANISLERLVSAMDDSQLEEFVRRWVSKKQYHQVQRFSGPGDMGRDVVGYISAKRHEGPWHNYQCKQYGRTLPTQTGITELGKVLYFANAGEFTPPTAFYFVAPRGINRNLRRYISKPQELKDALIGGWDKYCASSISEGQHCPLTSELRVFLEAWDFSAVSSISTDEILQDPASKPILRSWLDIDPGSPPLGTSPEVIEPHELPYIQQLVDAYSERACTVIDKDSVQSHAEHSEHLKMQRERFFDAASFERFYRDNTMHEDIDLLRRDIRHGIAETHRATYPDTLGRIDAVMCHASTIQTSGVLARHALIPVRQGMCHHFANEGLLKWRKN